MNTHTLYVWIVAACVAPAWGAGAAEPPPTAEAEPARVELFSPQGTMRQVRQVTARFNVPMVALGDPWLPDPFTVDCAASGKGRWADGRNWVYDFDADLPAGLECRLTLRDGLRALDGRALAPPLSFRFDTGGPAIVASFPREGWEEIDEEQILLLKLDAPATTESIASHAYCVVQGLAERIPLKLLTDDARREVLAQRASLGYQYYQLLWKEGRVSGARVRDRSLEQAEDTIVVASCARRLPAAAEVHLIWGAGIAAAGGLATKQDQKLAFRVRPAFTAAVECSRTNADAGCIPFQAITVRFAAPVPQAQALGAFLTDAAGHVYRPAPSPEAKAPTVMDVRFNGPFPDSEALTVHLPADLRDDAGRPLENAARFPLELKVDVYPPLAKFSGTFGILEWHEGGVLPVTLRNVEAELPGREQTLPGRVLDAGEDAAAIGEWLRRVEKANENSGEWQRDPVTGAVKWREMTGMRSVFAPGESPRAFTLVKPLGPRPAEVVGIPLGKPGFYVVELESRVLGASLLGQDVPRHVSTAALVTDLSVHFLWGRESSHVWVTRLSDAGLVSGAGIEVRDYCSGASLWQGTTDTKGLAVVDMSLGDPHGSDFCESPMFRPLIVLARHGEDFSFTVSSFSRGISPDSFGLRGGSWNGADLYHSVLDRPLFRAGETVSMKHFIRRHTMQGVEGVDQLPGTRKVTIAHHGSDQRFVVTVPFDANGTAEQRWEIPRDAKLGDYSISIEDPRLRSHFSGRFKVEEYRLPTMRATVQGPARPLVNAKEATLDLHVAYLSGGSAGGLPVTLRSVVEPRPMQFSDYADFQFGGAPVVEGIVESGGSRWDYDFERGEGPKVPKARVMPLVLDTDGAARVTIPDLPALEGPAQLIAELEYADANGELLATAGRVRLLPSAISLGIRREGWVASADQLRFKVVALGLDARPVARQRVSVTLYQVTRYSYRKRLIGGFYAYETISETKRLKRGCSGLTNPQGLLVCELKPGVSGEIQLHAETRDSGGNASGATASIWVAGEDEWWFGGTAGDRMDVLPEQKEYESGQVARFQVRMPFRSATALVSVEREGVIESFVTTLKGKAPVVEVPVRNHYSPNVYVAVLAVRGRVERSERSRAQRAKEGADITALVDLNKPAYRLGVGEIRVGWKPHRLNVRVTPERSTYRVRDRASVKLQVARADGKALPAGTEIALAAVDEALLELAPNPSWALLEAMMGERGLDVWTSTAQMQVVGKRHYGRKAVPHGGGGGRERARELFESLLVWQPRVLLDANGEATVTVPLNDSLSSFRIVAVAHGGTQLFGTGSASIATTQDLILLSGLPPLVREGDRYAATFTLRNTTDQPVQVDVEAALQPTLGPALERQRMEIPGGAARDIVWPVVAPVGVAELQWTVSARLVGGAALDRISVVEKVIPAYPVRTYQATIAQLTSPLSLPGERPRAAIPGRGGLDISLRARLGDGLDGVREYMREYRYICLEQNLSRAVALRSKESWAAWMTRLPAYLDRDGLLKYFQSDLLDGEDALTAYVLAIAHEAGWEIPDATRQRLVAALTGFVEGRIVRESALPTADLAIRKLAAIDALSRYGAAQPRMLDSVTIEPNLWPTSAVLDWIGILRRVQGVPKADEQRRAAEGILRARLNFQGTTMGFSTSRSDALWWLMISEDSNALRMLLAVLDEPAWRDDIPRLVRGALGRQQRGRWNTTVANAWGVLAMEKFSLAFESMPVTGATRIQYGPTRKLTDWSQVKGEASVAFPWLDQRVPLDVTHAGAGKPWITVRASAALPLAAPVSTGFAIVRTVTPVTQRMPGRWTRGDVARVTLELEAQSDMTWVVVDDPVPGGASLLGSGLGGQSNLLQRGERRAGWAWPAFEERRFDAFRAYYRFVPRGKWTVEYTVRLNNPGTFLLPATRVEALYAPEMLGELPNAALTVEAAP
jgi:uncharacterized protein YfaS (alpha-2-macroglobulin family)